MFKYYGYADENYPLISQLCHGSREFLFKNLKSLIKQNMFSKRRNLEIIKPITYNETKTLLLTQK